MLGAHQAILQRDPDPQFFESAIRTMERETLLHDLTTAYAQIVGSIWRSEEAARRRRFPSKAPRLVPFMPEATLAPLHGAKIYAFGCEPWVAWLLAASGLNPSTSPLGPMQFPLPALLPCLREDFARVLVPYGYERNPDFHDEAAPKLVEYVHEALQRETGDLVSMIGEGPIEVVLQRQRWRFDRLLDDLNADAPLFLVQMFRGFPDDEAVFRELAAHLAKAAPRARLVGVALLDDPPSGPFPEPEIALQTDNALLFSYRSLSAPAARGFSDPLDDLVIMRVVAQALADAQAAAA